MDVQRSGRARGGALLAAIAAPDNLYRAWETVRDRDAADGAPSDGMLVFSRDPAASLGELASQLLSRAYRPAALTRVEIPKHDGGVRMLAIPPVRDRVAERAVYQVLERLLDPEFTPNSYAYRPGLGVDAAIDAVVEAREAEARWFVRADFRDCFDSLHRSRLLAWLSRRVDDPDTVALAGRLLGRPVRRARHLEWPVSGAPQGAALSPLLCNLYLHAFDLAMLAHGSQTIRYADDLVIPVESEAAAAESLRLARAEARAIGLDLNSRKSRTVSIDEGFSFVGATFGPTVPPLRPPGRARPRTKAVYVLEQGASVRLGDGQLQVAKGKEMLLAVPIEHVGQIVLYGSIALSAWLRHHALRTGIDVVFLARRGSYMGRLDGTRPVDTDLRRLQYVRSDEEALRLTMAGAFVCGKIANLRALLLRYGQRAALPELAQTAVELERIRRAACRARSTHALLGHEGAASRAYFRGLARLLDPEFGFARRERRPTPDPVNSALSFGYSLLSGEATGAVAAAGLDPHIGFLHTREQGRPSLALDLMEEFRPLVVDAVVVESFRRRTLTRAHFTTEDDGRRCLLTEEGRRRLISAYEERQLTLFSHVPSGQRTSYRRALFLQARQLAAILRGLKNDYRPVAWR